MSDEKGELPEFYDLSEEDFQQGSYGKVKALCEGVMKEDEVFSKKGFHAIRNQARVHEMQANWSKALQYADQALRIAQDLGEAGLESEAYRQFGNIYWRLGVYRKTLIVLDLAVKKASESGNGEALAKTYRLLSLILAEQCRFDEARETIAKALAIETERNDVLKIAYCHNQKGMIEEYDNSIPAALSDFGKCVEAAKDRDMRLYHYARVNVARLLTKSGTEDGLKEAERLVQEALPFFEKTGDAEMLGGIWLVWALLEKDGAEARAMFEKAIHTFNSIGSLMSHAWSCYEYSLFLDRLGEKELAEKYRMIGSEEFNWIGFKSYAKCFH